MHIAESFEPSQIKSHPTFLSPIFVRKARQTPQLCLPKSPISSSSSRSRAGRTPNVRESPTEKRQIYLGRRWGEELCIPGHREQLRKAGMEKSFTYNTFADQICVLLMYSRPRQEVEQEQPDQVQGPMPQIPVHPDPQGRQHREGRQDQAVSATWYVLIQIPIAKVVWVQVKVEN